MFSAAAADLDLPDGIPVTMDRDLRLARVGCAADGDRRRFDPDPFAPKHGLSSRGGGGIGSHHSLSISQVFQAFVLSRR